MQLSQNAPAAWRSSTWRVPPAKDWCVTLVKMSILSDWVSELLLMSSMHLSSTALSVRLCCASLGHVSALLGGDLLAAALDDLVELLRLHALEAVDQGEFLLLGYRRVSILHEMTGYPLNGIETYTS